RLPRIPPTGVGGSFKSSLQTRAARPPSQNPTHGSGWIVQVQPTISESHPREWVDRSSPAYKRGRLARLLRILPTGVGGSFKSSLQTRAARPPSQNPTHGSGWIVQVQP